MDASRADLADWFDESELEDCPQCGQKRLEPSQSPAGAFRVCLDCGVLLDNQPDAAT